ncbi:unnamed protein product [Spirodela intermedia]|uniref:Uncharacterized protein n=1 Tax=Spirodela intermedia TaxID=51605 RepID=A0A7I8LJA6_SPIIN|nr:unnamed protein product [Spirodela intermedia]
MAAIQAVDFPVTEEGQLQLLQPLTQICKGLEFLQSRKVSGCWGQKREGGGGWGWGGGRLTSKVMRTSLR